MKEFLSPEESKKLRLQHRFEKNGRRRDRIKAILLSDKGWTFKMIEEALLLDEETISLHVSEYIEKKKLSLETSESQSKLNKEQTELLIEHLEMRTYQPFKKSVFMSKKNMGEIIQLQE